MNRQITKKQYVIIDMIILAVVLCVLEAASRWALDFFRRELFTISIVLPVTLIAMMRHGAVGTALAALGGTVYCMVNHAQAGIYVVYIIGNTFIVANLLWFRNSGKQKIAQSKGRIAFYVLTGYLLINLGRSVMAAAMGYPDILAVAVRYFTTDALSAVMAFIILLIARRQDGVFEDQTEYLKRQADKEEKAMQAKHEELTEEQVQIQDELERDYWKIVWRKMKKDWRLYVMLLPLLLIFFFWRYLPLYGLLTAFKTSDTTVNVLQRDFVGFQHFYSLIFGADSSGFWQAFRNTFLLSFYALLFGFPMPIILALFFNEIKSNGYRSFLQVSTYLPRFVSTVVITTLVTMLLKGGSVFSEPGIVAKFLVKLGMVPAEDALTGMLYIPKYFRAIYQVSGIWETAGYGSIVYFAAIISISPTSYEAAKIDGASKMQQIKHVVLPGILSTITIMLIMQIGRLLTIGYEKVLLLYNSYTYSTADVVSTYVFQRAGIQAGAQTNQSLASAADMINAVTSMLLVMGANLISKKVSNTSLY